jgi:plasmid stabilization system protein ParE
VTVRLLDVAEIELDEAIRWYEAQAPGLSDAFLIEVLSAFDRISLFQQLGNVWPRAHVVIVLTASLMG